MPDPNEWTDADFVPQEPTPSADSAPSADAARRAEIERLEWFRCEIRARPGAGATQAEVVSWLVTQGYDPGAALGLIRWAKTAPPYQPPGGSVVVYVEMHYETGEVVTDPVASARARAAARKQRAKDNPDAPAPEFEFAQPAAAQARLAQGTPIRTRLIVGAVVIAAIAAIAFVVLR